MSRFQMSHSPDTLQLLDAIVDRMVALFDISQAEAVARINQQWDGQDLSCEGEIILHEDDRYWALFLYFGEDIPDYPQGTKSPRWAAKPAPPTDSGYWTLKE